MKKIQVLLKPQCNAEIQNQFATKFGDQCEFTFQGKETEDAIAAAEVVIGEPEEEEILKAENLRFTLLSVNMRNQTITQEKLLMNLKFCVIVPVQIPLTLLFQRRVK